MAVDVKVLSERLRVFLEPLGFEVHPFLVGWYNAKVSHKFALDFPADTLAFVVVSQPSMFEKCFVPFLKREKKLFQAVGGADGGGDDLGLQDPLDTCMRETFAQLRKSDVFSNFLPLTVMHDFDLQPNRRPRVLVQTAAHVAGAVRYLQETDVNGSDNTDRLDKKKKKTFPVCLHEKFGGWFAIRAVLVWGGSAQMEQPPPVLPSLSQETIVKALRLYNEQWQDWSFRDVIAVEERYSERQREYFGTPPGKRWSIIQRLAS